MATNDIGSAVDALLGSQSCSPIVGRRNNCWECDGGGIVGSERTHHSCPSCDGTGLAYTLEQLIELKGCALTAMRRAHCEGNVERREEMRGEVAHWDDMIADLRRSGRAA